VERDQELILALYGPGCEGIRAQLRASLLDRLDEAVAEIFDDPEADLLARLGGLPEAEAETYGRSIARAIRVAVLRQLVEGDTEGYETARAALSVTVEELREVLHEEPR
jgi:hypothetical protein